MSGPTAATVELRERLEAAAAALVDARTDVPAMLAHVLERHLTAAARYGTPRAMRALDPLAVAVLELAREAS